MILKAATFLCKTISTYWHTTNKSGLTRSDLYDTICMTLIRLLFIQI